MIQGGVQQNEAKWKSPMSSMQEKNPSAKGEDEEQGMGVLMQRYFTAFVSSTCRGPHLCIC